MKFARTIRLDPSDANVYPVAAEPGEWAITGTFAYVDGEPEAWSNKQQLAFKSGWLGTGSFGRSTFVQVAVIPDAEFEETVRRIAGHLYQEYGAPDMMAALDAARLEAEDMVQLCDHAAGTLLSIEREFDANGGVHERVRVVPRADTDGGGHAQIWRFEEDEEEKKGN
jgi:hypothetical protein